MRITKLLLTVAVLTTVLTVVPGAFAAGPFVHFVGAGSSALYNGFEVAAVNDVAPAVAACQGGGNGVTCTIHHWSQKTGDCSGICAGLVDDRSGAIGTQYGNIWIVWVNSGPNDTGTDTDVWTDVSVDSTVGVRTFLARDATTDLTATSLNIGPASGVTADNSAAATASLLYGCQNNSGTCASGASGDDKTIPADVFTALNGAGLTAGLTDIRPEDARYATKRTDKGLDPSGFFAGLGYASAGSALTGTPIQSGTGTSTATAQPVNFALPGFNDPFNGQPVPTTITVIPVGEDPVVLLANRTDASGLGTLVGGAPYYSNVYATVQQPPASGSYVTKLGKLFMGKDCTGDAAAFGQYGYAVAPGPAVAAGQVVTIQGVSDPSGIGDLKFFIPNTQTPPPVNAWVSIGGTTNGTYDGVYQVLMSNNSGTQGVNGNQNSFQVVDNVDAGIGPDVAETGTASWWTAAQNFPINVIIREPLSGTYNTFEFSSVRIFGGPNGSSTAGTSISSKSQDANWDPTQTTVMTMPNPTKATSCWGAPIDGSTNGTRTRAIGTGEMVKGAGGGGVLGTTDGLGYAFFSFSNVSAIATSTKYGYLTIDTIDPIFAQYGPGGSDPGQPAAANGELPACSASKNGTSGQGCLPGDVWNSGNSFPNLRNGTYRAWSLLRTVCDTAVHGCTNTNVNISGATFSGGDVTYTYSLVSGSPLVAGQSIIIKMPSAAADSGTFAIATVGPGNFTVVNAGGVTSATAGTGLINFGAEGLIAQMQDDIHFPTAPYGHGVADFLPFSQDGTFGTGCTAGTPCQGDAGAYRQHFVPGLDYDPVYANSDVGFWNPTDGTTGEDPSNSPEAGGDVGGCIVVGFPENNSNLNCQQ